MAPMKIRPATRRQGAAPMRPRMASARTQAPVCRPAPPSPAILARNREVQRGLGREEGRFPDFRSGISSDNRILYSSISSINAIAYRNIMEARVGIEPTNKGFADLCLTTWLPRHRSEALALSLLEHGAGDGTRTRDIDLGKVALYQLSYSRR